MKTFIISDTHFGQKNLAVKFQTRPENFDIRIINNWYTMIAPEDLVIHLGDVLIGSREEWDKVVPGLTGRKILVRGNHDERTNSWYIKNGFDFCCESFQTEMYGVKIMFSHKPAYEGDFELNIHGHLHDGRHREIETDERHMLFALEKTKYQPLLLKTMVETWQKNRKREGPHGKKIK